MTSSVAPPTELEPSVSGPAASTPANRVLVVTGISGAGRATALKALEDLGYEAVDNLPLSLVPALMGHRPLRAPLAIGADVRTRDFGAGALADTLDRMALEGGTRPVVVFLDCDDAHLVQRFTETRRRHPLAADRPVIDGIRLERSYVSPLRERADLVIDTSDLSPADLKRVLTGHFALDRSPGIALSVLSFSYRHGLPRDADIVFDARFLRNPHYVATLKPLTGLDPAVGAYIAEDADFAGFFRHVTELVAPLLPRFEREGKSYLTIAIGCTGGRHRSVYLAERLAAWLGERGRAVSVRHRDIDRPGAASARAGGAAEGSSKDLA
ncbi:MAG TPA: RNase adapter RapZ [Stellaceae bacterium]|nr:RNase adapter RapZ [Stellaceae bacterium]